MKKTSIFFIILGIISIVNIFVSIVKFKDSSNAAVVDWLSSLYANIVSIVTCFTLAKLINDDNDW